MEVDGLTDGVCDAQGDVPALAVGGYVTGDLEGPEIRLTVTVVGVQGVGAARNIGGILTVTVGGVAEHCAVVTPYEGHGDSGCGLAVDILDRTGHGIDGLPFTESDTGVCSDTIVDLAVGYDIGGIGVGYSSGSRHVCEHIGGCDGHVSDRGDRRRGSRTVVGDSHVFGRICGKGDGLGSSGRHGHGRGGRYGISDTCILCTVCAGRDDYLGRPCGIGGSLEDLSGIHIVDACLGSGDLRTVFIGDGDGDGPGGDGYAQAVDSG